ncbi:CAP domain-containing protein [Peribacillus deserti]|uniref:Sporulation protein n=1 Tax=Peribacillus deserti TaxID=673318 RepID=A0A2N5M2W9_9BACI|nr:CAP domain-containing protein [Peribacillus deserti]PLT28708.1 sporulation protein [Peribacillus deserti]
MKKKFLLSIAAAAAVTFSGAATKQADASTITNAKPTVMQFNNYQDFNNYVKSYLAKYNVNCNFAPAPAKQAAPAPAKQAAPAPAKQAAPAPAKQAAPAPAKQAAPAPAKQTTTAPTASTGQLSAYEQKVVELTNAERSKQGLAALKVDAELSKVARIKSQDMHDKNYFDHNSPTYGSPFDMMKKFGITYKSAGENIAQGQPTPEEVVKAWMNSSGHRANILNSGYTHIGVGYVADKHYWTQQFISK